MVAGRHQATPPRHDHDQEIKPMPTVIPLTFEDSNVRVITRDGDAGGTMPEWVAWKRRLWANAPVS